MMILFWQTLIYFRQIEKTCFCGKYPAKQSVVLKSGAYKDAGSPARQMTEQDKQVLNDVLMDMYYQFTDIVIQRRGMPKYKVMALANNSNAACYGRWLCIYCICTKAY